MADRRTARATRLLDPVWHQLRDALDKLYAEVEPNSRVGALNVMVENADGTTVSYAVHIDKPHVVLRHIITDEQRFIDVLGEAAVDATPEGS